MGEGRVDDRHIYVGEGKTADVGEDNKQRDEVSVTDSDQ